jgi:flavin-dependent dehydrogenase
VSSEATNSPGLKQEFWGRVVVGADAYRSIVARKTGSYAIDQAHWLSLWQAPLWSLPHLPLAAFESLLCQH